MARHLMVIDRALTDSINRSGRLILTVPPRHGKSELVSKYLPAWFLGNFPDRRVILASYEAEFAASWGRKVRSIIEERGEWFGVAVDPRSSSADRWDIDKHAGGMVTAGVGGPITGKGADLLIIDDPVKNFEEAHSEVYREKTWEWFRSTAYTRLEPGGSAVVIQTRWHEDDLTGRILEHLTHESWQLIRFPAVSEEDDSIGRKRGDPLWPVRFDAKTLDQIRLTLGSYNWNALYQQRPTPEGGNQFRPRGWPRFRDMGDAFSLPLGTSREIFLYSEVPILVGIDIALKDKKDSDFTSFVAGGLTRDGRLLILEVVNQRIRWENLASELAKFCAKWRPVVVASDDDNLSTVMLQEYRRWPNIPEVRTLPVRGRNKRVRATEAIVMGENGRIYLPYGTPPWLDGFCDQLARFTGISDVHDDQVDAVSIVARLVNLLRAPASPWQEEPSVLVEGRLGGLLDYGDGFA